jgi:uncharacterized OB-fold protein/acyl dehydratase
VSEAAALLDRLRAIVGVFSAAHTTRDDVNQPMIRHWCEAMSDHNPVYTDPVFAAKSVHGGIVAPPTMLDTWLMLGQAPRLPQLSEAGEPVGLVPVMEGLDAAGFTGIIATNTTHEYDRYLRLGDRLRVRSVLTKVSDEKKTAIGIGHFLTAATEFVDQNGERVGRIELRVLKFKPGTGSIPTAADFADAPSPGQRPRPAISRDTKFFWDGIDAGELRIQQCTGCRALHHPPVVRCPTCGAYDLGYVVSTGRGTVYSFAEIHHPQFPMFQYPLLGVLVELEEGTRILSNLIAVEPDRVQVGMPVELAIETVAVDPELSLPFFRPARPPRRETTLRCADVKVGDLLPPCPVPITPTLIVAGAIASQDFEGVHHDAEIARKRGSPNIFMNIMTTGGLTGRYVTDWAGPEALVRNMKIRLGIPNFPGDTMTFVGQVNAIEIRGGGGIVEVGVRGFNRLGDHVSGTLDLELPVT